MATVLDYASGVMPETMAVLIEKHADAVDARVHAVKSMLLVSQDHSTNENGLTEFAKSYLGDVVAYELIPTGIDYWMVATKLNKNLGRPSGVALGGENAQNYDRVRGLQDLAKKLLERILKYAQMFAEEEGAGGGFATTSPLMVSSRGKFKTLDPEEWPSLLSSPTYVGGRFGVVVPVGDG